MLEDQYDVIVVGAGGSGLAAAVSAAEHGASVLVLEKQAEPGGTTGIAVGSFTAAETDLQRAARITDSAEDHAVDAGKFADPIVEERNNDPLRAWFLEQTADTLRWLQGFGLTFVGPHPEPPNRVPRMHNVVPAAKAYIAALQMDLQKRGGQLNCGAEVTEVLREGNRVSGVQVTIDGRSRRILAKRGVVLAAGDYANNGRMIAEHKGEQYSQIEGINPRATGDGHRLAEDVGAQLVNMDVTYGPELRFVTSAKRPFQQLLPSRGWSAKLMGIAARCMPLWLMQKMIKRLLVTWQHPENSLFEDGAILVNKQGERFVDETTWPAREIGVAAQPDKIAYIVLDGRLVERYSAWPHFISTAPNIAYAYVRDYQRLRPDVTHSGDSLEQAAARAGVPADALQQSVDDANSQRVTKLQSGPWVLLGPLKAWFTTTEGGAAINEQLQVLDPSGQVIRGLYAVGQNGLGGMVLWGHGLHIAWAMTSGRLTGQSIMYGGSTAKDEEAKP